MDEELRARFDRREETLGRVRDLLIRDLKVRREPAELDPDTPLFGAGLGLDSIDAVELVVCFEAEFGIQMSDQPVAMTAMRTINTLVDRALEHIEARGEAS